MSIKDLSQRWGRQNNNKKQLLPWLLLQAHLSPVSSIVFFFFPSLFLLQLLKETHLLNDNADCMKEQGWRTGLRIHPGWPGHWGQLITYMWRLILWHRQDSYLTQPLCMTTEDESKSWIKWRTLEENTLSAEGVVQLPESHCCRCAASLSPREIACACDASTLEKVDITVFCVIHKCSCCDNQKLCILYRFHGLHLGRKNTWRISQLLWNGVPVPVNIVS